MRNTVSTGFAKWLSGLLLGHALLSFSAPALASNDSKALKLAEQALYEDYLNLEFDKAERKLNEAISLCEAACSDENKARVYRDLGVLKVAGQQQRPEGIAMFKKAIETYPAITLDADLSTPDIESAFQEAKATAGTGASDDPMLSAMRQSVGDKPTEEEPLPPELQEGPSPEPEPAPKEETKPLLLEEEPEEERPSKPLEKLDLGVEDCPPDFPGCESFDSKWDDEDADADAAKHPKYWLHLGFQADFLMLDTATGVCATDSLQCFYGGDTYRDPSLPLGAQAADGTVAGGGDIQSGFALATQRVMLGFDYALTNHFLLGARAGFAFGGGPQKTTIAGPGNKFQPIHAEARVAYWFGGVKSGLFRPFFELSGGMAQVDAVVRTPIVDRNPNQVISCQNQGREDDPSCLVTEVNAWKKTGTVFISGGLGTLIAFGDAHGVTVEGRLMQMFGSPGLGGGAVLGYALGF